MPAKKKKPMRKVERLIRKVMKVMAIESMNQAIIRFRFTSW